MTKTSIMINGEDNVAVALCNLAQGEMHYGVTLLQDIPKGHKFALCNIAAGNKIIKCGYPVAHAKNDICSGEHVHTHNADTNLTGGFEYSYNPANYTPPEVASRTVNVYRRENGEAGIRNELWILPVSGCVNGQAELILKTFKSRYGTKGFDGAFALTHPYSDWREGGEKITRTILQKIVRHPNAGGVLVLGSGNTDDFRVTLGAVNNSRIKFLDCREVEDEIETGVQILNKIAELMKMDTRTKADISELKIGLMCGDSDSLSGITANPLIGRFTDYLTAAGGTAAICEVPETFGTEQFIMNRADTQETFEKTFTLVNCYKDYFRKNGRTVYRNPSPENIEGGITTIEEMSVSRTQKSGLSPVTDVVSENEFISHKGLNILNGPDDDMGAVTSLVASGCHLVLFATGLGNPFGGLAPTIKISSNSQLAIKKSNWIDFDAGAVLENGYDTQLEKIIDLVVAVAGGKLAKNEVNNSRGMAIIKSEISL